VKKFKDHLTESNPLTLEDELVLDFLTDEDIKQLKETSIDPNTAQFACCFSYAKKIF